MTRFPMNFLFPNSFPISGFLFPNSFPSYPSLFLNYFHEKIIRFLFLNKE